MTDEEKFKQELRELLKRYGIKYESMADYDDDENPTGDHAIFIGRGFMFDAGDIVEMIDNV